MPTDTRESLIPRKVAFVAMPFGKRASGLRKEGIPGNVDFDAIWDKAVAPALEELGYAVVRADRQSGSVIVKDMLEHLVYSDLVIADISIANANVYYEAGVRHVAQEKGCLLIGANWAEPAFDLGQIRQVRYPYGSDNIREIDFDAIKLTIMDGVQDHGYSTSPVYELTDYPNLSSLDRVSSFQNMVTEMSNFQRILRMARLESGDSSKASVVKLVNDFHKAPKSLDSAAIELLALVRDRLGWSEVINFVEKLPADIERLPYIQEQLLLAKAKSGEVHEAIASLEILIREFGGTPERYGLLGGRYKSLYYDNNNENKDYNLEQAIKYYQTGMNMDLNKYYCACNLPRLLKSRGQDGDSEQAKFIAKLVVKICNLRIQENRLDGWEHPTLLGAAFDTEDIKNAKSVVLDINKTNYEQWYLETTLKDLKHGTSLFESKEVKLAFESLVNDLSELLK